MKGVRHQGQCNIHNKRIDNYEKRNKMQLLPTSCNVCGPINNATTRTSILKFIENIGDNSIVFHDQGNNAGDFASALITYDVGPKFCGDC